MRTLSTIVLLIVLFSCGSNKKKELDHGDGITVVAVNYPLYYFAKRVGGELIQLEFSVPTGTDPAYWIPDDEALSQYQSADIILANGADYAKWINNVSLPSSRILNTSKAAKEKYIASHESITHSHGPDGAHEHTGYAFTTWLDFGIALIQAEAIRDIFIRALPESKSQFEERFDALKTELILLDQSMKKASAIIGNQAVIGSHPVYQYLANAYGLNIKSVHFEPDEMPSAKQWEEFDQLLADHQPHIMLWEDEPLPEIEGVLKERGIRVVIFNPCGNTPDHGDFMEVMKTNIQSLSDHSSANF